MTRAKAWILGLVTSVAVVGTALAATAPSAPSGPVSTTAGQVTTYTVSLPESALNEGFVSITLNWGDGASSRLGWLNGTVVNGVRTWTFKHAWTLPRTSPAGKYYTLRTDVVYPSSVAHSSLVVFVHP